MSEGAQKPLLVSCSIFRREIAALGLAVTDRVDSTFLDSMLHMRPHELDAILLRLAETADRPTLLVYGDCCPHMGELSQLPHVRKVSGINCCDIILGRAAYRRLQRGGTFFFMPEWTERWEEVFRFELGLASANLASEFMHEMHKRLVYLDTGLTEIPGKTLANIEAFFDMPVEVMPIGLEHLKMAVLNGLQKVDEHA